MTTLLKFNAAPLQEFQSVLLHASFIKSQLTLCWLLTLFHLKQIFLDLTWTHSKQYISIEFLIVTCIYMCRFVSSILSLKKSDNILYNTLGRWVDHLIDQVSDGPSIILID